MSYAPGVRLVKKVRIPMRDGTRLAGDLYMPDEATEPPSMPRGVFACPT